MHLTKVAPKLKPTRQAGAKGGLKRTAPAVRSFTQSPELIEGMQVMGALGPRVLSHVSRGARAKLT